MSDNDFTIYIINVLSLEFETISTTFLSRYIPIHFEELYDKLIEHANYRKITENKNDGIPITIHAASKTSSSLSKANFTLFYQSKHSAPSSIFKGCNQQLSTIRYKRHYQLCSRLGHYARYCPLLKHQWTYTPTLQPNSFPRVPSPQAFHFGSVLGPPPSAPSHFFP